MLGSKVDVSGFKEEVERLRKSRLAIILLVYFALVVDNMLLTVVVPIIPDYLYQMEYQSLSLEEKSSGDSDNPLPVSNTMEFKDLQTKERPASPTGSKTYTHEIPVSHTTIKSSMDPAYKGSWLGSSSSGIPPGDEDSSLLPAFLDSGGFRGGSGATYIVLDGLGHNMRKRQPDTGNSKVDIKEDFKENLLKRTKRRKRDSKSDGRLSKNWREYLNVDSLKQLGSIHLTKKSSFSSNNNGNEPAKLPAFNNAAILNDSSYFPKLNANSAADERQSDSRNFNSIPSISNSSTPLLPSPSSNPTEPQPSVVKPFENQTKTPQDYHMPDIQPLNESLSNQNVKLPQDIINENGRVGLLFSSKAFVQLIVNPFIGPLTSRVGYSLPLLIGTHNLILSALLFAYAESYTLLFIARSIQGIASSCIAISGMGMIAECYQEDKERGRMQGMVMGGIALGVLAGYPLGGLLYDFTNSKAPPFLLVAALAAVLSLIQLAVLNPRPAPERLVIATPIGGLIRDPYILVTAGAVMVSTSAMAVLEPCLPIWLTETLHPKKWQLGTAFIPDSIGYLVGTSCTAGPSYRIGRWRAALIAMMMVAFAAATVPEAGSMLALAGPHLFLGMGVGTVDAALMPLLAAIVDARHVAAYGAVYAIAQGAVALAYGFGPLVGGAVVRHIGFPWLMRGVAILNLCYCPLLFTLTSFTHDPDETQAILMAAPDPHDYKRHITTGVQPREASLSYQQLFDEEED